MEPLRAFIEFYNVQKKRKKERKKTKSKLIDIYYHHENGAPKKYISTDRAQKAWDSDIGNEESKTQLDYPFLKERPRVSLNV